MSETSMAAEETIAIVGIGCKVPGADNIRDFWHVLLHGENHVTEIPPSRWNADAFYDPDPMTPGKAYVKRAGLVSKPDEFDNKVYGINDFEAAQMDPQQRFVLDCTLMALEDAGLTRAAISGSDTGVFIGVSNTDFRVLFRASSSGLSGYTVTGISNSIIAARLSYVLDLRGPSLVLDTACSSSLIGMHLACQAIRAGDCKMAIAGGTNFLTLPDVFVHLCKAGMMSRAGQCHAFGSKADGYIRGEGCGIVILKPLRDAERDGDKVWATLYTGSNQDGRTVSPITAPSGIQQQCLLQSVSSKVGLDLDRIDYIEAHGTGTSAGDPVEAKALGEFFQKQDAGSCKVRYLGSVKSNIGHLESAAGVVGVIKVLLMMKHNIIAPSLFCEEPNPQINFPELKLSVPGKPVNWETPNKVACCNSFGFGGSNSHAVLCEYTRKERENPTSTVDLKQQRPCIIALSACSEKSLRGMAEEMISDPDLHALNVHDLSLTSTVRRDHYPVRVAHVVDDVLDLTTALEEDLARATLGTAVYKQPKVTYVFGGMGTAWVGMCTELMDHLPVFRDIILQIEEELKSYVDWSLSERLRGDFDPQDPLFSPIAIFACQVAIATVWRDLGLEPQSIVGQSVGEVGAAHVAGCLTLGEAVKVVYHRSRLLATVTGGKMIIVRNVPVTKTRQVVTRYGDKACISLTYSPAACCISVDQDTLDQLRADLTSTLHSEHKGLQVIELHVPVAYHSAHVDPCRLPLAEALKDLNPRPPSIPLISSVTGLKLTSAPGAGYWVDNLRRAVQFDQSMLQSRDSQARQLFLEIGPKPVLRAHLSDIFPKADVVCVASMVKPPEYKVFLQAVVSVFQSGADLHWGRLPSWGSTITDLPRYVFDKKKNLLKSEESVLWLSGVDEGACAHPFVFPLKASSDFKLLVGSSNLQSVYDHVVGGKVLMPGAVYAETGFAVANYLSGHNGRRWSVSVDFEQAVVVPKDSFLDLDVLLDNDLLGNRKASVQSAADGDAGGSDGAVSGATEVGSVVAVSAVKDGKVLANIRISEVTSDQPPTELVNVEHVRSRCPDKVGKDVIYGSLRHAGFMYGEAFTMLEDACANDKECLCTLRVHPTVQREMGGTTLHPAVLDCMLQSCLIITGREEEEVRDKELLPKALGRLTVHRPLTHDLLLVHSKVKAMAPKQHFYDLKLLTACGTVVAELDGLVINLIMEADEHSLKNMYVTSWSHVSLLPKPSAGSDVSAADHNDDETAPVKGGDFAKDVVFLTDHPLSDDVQGASGQGKTLSVQGMDFTHGMPASVHHFLTANKKADALVVLCLERLPENADADAMAWQLLNRSFLYKELLTLLNRLMLSVPLYLCTCNAWPSPSLSSQSSPSSAAGHHDPLVDPAATGLWGLCRTVLSERLYPFTLSVELQLSPLSLPFLTSLFDTLTSDPDLKPHAELLVGPGGIYGNQIFPVNPSTSVPMFRTNSLGPKENAILLSKEASAVVAPHAVPRDVTSPASGSGSAGRVEKEEFAAGGPEVTHVRAQAYALQSASLLRLKMPYERLDQSQTSKSSGFPVFAVEVHGTVLKTTSQGDASRNPATQNGKTSKSGTRKGKNKMGTTQTGKSHKLNGKTRNPKNGGGMVMVAAPTLKCGEGEEVVACYPVAMATQVSVPTSVTLPSSLLPGYQPGDLAKLLLLQELQEKVELPAVTLLASGATRHYGEVLQEFLKDRRHGKAPYVTNVVMADQLTSSLKVPLHETVISLVLLDGGLMSSLIDCWNKAKTLVTCSSLLQSDALSCASCFAEDVEVVVVDTQLLYHPISLKRRVPRVGQWLTAKSSSGALGSIMDCLHYQCHQQQQEQEQQNSGQSSEASEEEKGHGSRAVVDLCDLLHFDTSQMTSLQMQVSKDELFRKNSVYLVVGGLSGLGWLYVQYLAQKHAGHIAILNRRLPSQEQRDNMATLASRHDCHVTAFQGDVTSLSSLTAVLESIEASFPGAGLKGVFFGAAVTADKSFLTMDVPGFDSALSPKVRGTWNLHTLTKNVPLDYFVMHSSIASVVGNAGQANYAAGNAFMDGLAHLRRQRGLAGQSINWGVLDLGLLSINDMAKEMLESRGFLLMSVQEIQDVLTPLLMLNWAQCVPVKLDRERLSQRMYREGSVPILTRMKPILTTSVQEEEEDLLQVVHMAKSLSPDERLSVYEQYVQVLVSRVLSVELSSVTLEVSLLDLGMDSVGAMTLINQIHRDTSRRLTALQLLSGDPTVLTVAEAINEAPEEEEAAAAAEGEGGTPRIEEITEEQQEDPAASEASVFESHQLRVYRDHPRPELMHIAVNIPLQNTQADHQLVQTAAQAALVTCPSARTTFTEDKGSGKVTFRRSLLPQDQSCVDLRVTEEEEEDQEGGGGVGGRSVDAQSRERMDLERRGPVRFLLAQSPSKSVLRLVLHKVTFDHISAALFAQSVKRCLESPGSAVKEVPRQPDWSATQLQWKQILGEVHGAAGSQTTDYWTGKLSSVDLGSTSLISDHSGWRGTDSVTATVSPDVVQRMKTFIKAQDITLLSIIASSLQVLLHSLTGQTTIPLLFPLDMRILHSDVISDEAAEGAANLCSELPLLADFGSAAKDKTNRNSSTSSTTTTTTTLRKFVLENNGRILKDIEHGGIPLSLLDPLQDLLDSTLTSTPHGITIERLHEPSATNGSGGPFTYSSGVVDVAASSPPSSSSPSSSSGKKGRQVLRFMAASGSGEEPAVLALGLETCLHVRHLLSRDALTLTLTFQRVALDRWKARVLLSELLFLVLRTLSHSDTALRKMARRGPKLRRQLEKCAKRSVDC